MNELLEKIESYYFKDPLGHPLVNCVDWIDLKEIIHEMQEAIINASND